jgi:hypothetical protein
MNYIISFLIGFISSFILMIIFNNFIISIVGAMFIFSIIKIYLMNINGRIYKIDDIKK